MANKEIVCVYQDCPLCGDRGKKVLKIVHDKGLNIRKVSFASEEGKDLIHTALFKHKIGSLPFYTDGERFSNKVEDILEKPKKKTTKKKEVVDGADK